MLFWIHGGGFTNGGACQALLERDLRVIGVDPAKMDERLLKHPNFTHVRARAADLKRKEFADVRWLIMDANIAPESTLEAIEHIVTNLVAELLQFLQAHFREVLSLVNAKGHRFADDFVGVAKGDALNNEVISEVSRG